MDHTGYLEPSPQLRELQLMELLAEQPETSQSVLAARVGLTPARVNAYIRIFAERGHLVAEHRSRGMVYRLTPEGRHCLTYHQVSYRAELVRLARSARERFREFFRELGDQGVRRIVLYGAGETGEVVLDALAGWDGVRVVALVDDDEALHGRLVHGVPVSAPALLEGVEADAVVVASVTRADEIRARLGAAEARGLRIASIVA